MQALVGAAPRSTPEASGLERAFERERSVVDTRRAGYLALLLVALHLVIGEGVYGAGRWAPALELYRRGMQTAHRVDLLSLTLLFAPCWLLARRPGAAPWLPRVAPTLLTAHAMLYAAAVGVTSQRLNGNVNVFVMGCMVLATVFRLPLRDTLATYLGAAAVLVAGLHAQQPDAPQRVAAMPSIVAVVLFGAMTSWLNRAAARRQFALHAELASVNAALELRVGEQVREIVARADEVERLNQQLRRSVVEQAQQLRRALVGESDRADEEGVGDLIDQRVELLALLGRGASGNVFLGYDRNLARRVVVKLLRADARRPRSALERFVAEAELAARVEHPGVVKPLHVGVTPQGRFYHLFEYIEGEPLNASHARAPLSPDETMRVVAAIADALAAAHARGVIHRDVKPSNVLASPRAPGVFVLDFGISKLDDPAGAPRSLTEEGVLLGTPNYMAPEQVFDPGAVRTSADVYALALVWLELLQGLPRATGVSLMTMALRRMSAPAPTLRGSLGLPPDVVALFDAMISTDPERRPTADRVAATLTAAADARGVPEAPKLFAAREALPPPGTRPARASSPTVQRLAE